MKYEAILFDVSDTLVEYSPNYAKIYGDRLRSLGFEVSEEMAKEVSRMVNRAICQQNLIEESGGPKITLEELQILMDKAALSCVIIDNTRMKVYLTNLRTIEIPKQEMSIISGASDVLTVLKGKYRLGIVSNHYAWLMDYLHTCGLAPHFEAIVISDIVGVAKPNIKIMQIAIEELGLQAENCLYVGDQPDDVLCAKSAGMDCAWIVDDGSELPDSIPFREDYRISKLSDLLNIL